MNNTFQKAIKKAVKTILTRYKGYVSRAYFERVFYELFGPSWGRILENSLDETYYILAKNPDDVELPEFVKTFQKILLSKLDKYKKQTKEIMKTVIWEMIMHARAEAEKKVNMLVDWNKAPEYDIETLTDHHMFWIYENHSKDLLERVKNVSEKLFRDKKDLMQSALTFKRAFKDIIEEQDSYWIGYANHVYTTTTVMSDIIAMEQAGVEMYKVSETEDSRTCEVCRLMDGQTFEVKQAMKLVKAMLKAKNPDDVKLIRPWASRKKDIPEGFRNFIFPPFHYNCRGTLIPIWTSKKQKREVPIDEQKEKQKWLAKINKLTNGKLAIDFRKERFDNPKVYKEIYNVLGDVKKQLEKHGGNFEDFLEKSLRKIKDTYHGDESVIAFHTPIGKYVGISLNSRESFSGDWERYYETGIDLGWAVGSAKKYRYDGRQYYDIIMHEVGHAIDTYFNYLADRFKNRYFRDYVNMVKSYRNITPISDYSKQSPNEYFAEAFSWWMHHVNGTAMDLDGFIKKALIKRFEELFKLLNWIKRG